MLQQTQIQELVAQKKLLPPDFIIGDDDPYIRRWWMTERQPEDTKLYLHNQMRDDQDRALHDHPSDNISYILEGGYTEITPEGTFERKPGDVIWRRAEQLHRLVLRRDENGNIITSWSLFLMGPKVRDWGFQCEKGWVPWWIFCDPKDPGKVGRGCA